MRDLILGNADKGYSAYYDFDDNASNVFSCHDTAAEIRTHFIDFIYQGLKSLDLKKLMIRQDDKIELSITIQKEKVELKY